MYAAVAVLAKMGVRVQMEGESRYKEEFEQISRLGKPLVMTHGIRIQLFKVCSFSLKISRKLYSELRKLFSLDSDSIRQYRQGRLRRGLALPEQARPSQHRMIWDPSIADPARFLLKFALGNFRASCGKFLAKTLWIACVFRYNPPSGFI